MSTRLFWLIFVLCSMGFLALGILAGLQHKRIPPDDPLRLSDKKQPGGPTEMALANLLHNTPKELNGINGAVLNATCLCGLPGTIDFDPTMTEQQIELLASQMPMAEARMINNRFGQRPMSFDDPQTQAAMLMQELLDYGGLNDSQGPPNANSLPGQDKLVLFPHIRYDDFRGSDLHRPFLVLGVGEQLHDPVHLVISSTQLFVRWGGSDGVPSISMDGSGSNHIAIPPPDEFAPSDANQKYKSLTHQQILAFSMYVRGDILRSNHRIYEAQAAFAAAHNLDPGNTEYTATLTDLIKEEMQVHSITWKEVERDNGYYFNLTPTQSPQDLKP